MMIAIITGAIIRLNDKLSFEAISEPRTLAGGVLPSLQACGTGGEQLG
jgi:hypothetical protein